MIEATPQEEQVPKPETRNPKLETRNSRLETRNPETEPRSPKTQDPTPNNLSSDTQTPQNRKEQPGAESARGGEGVAQHV